MIRLMDPAFWATDVAAFPGAVAPAGSDGVPGLVWFRTSGTTGAPRWIGHTREGLLLSARVVNRHLAVGPQDIWGLALPLRHVGGFGLVARAFEAGCGLEGFPGPWDPQRFTVWLRERRVSHLSLVPTQVHDLVAARCRAPALLRAVVTGGGALAVREGRAARRLGWPVLPSYGMTEAASQIATAPLDALDGEYFSGPLPVLPHWDVECREDGRIAIRGGSLFVAGMREGGGGVDVAPRIGDWYLTGDRGRWIDGGLEVAGRADALVKILGELVDPAAVERRIGLPDAVVVAVPDRRRGRRLVVAVERMSDEVTDAVARHNAAAPGPERVGGPVVVERFPRGELGKIRRAELERRVEKRMECGNQRGCG